jgi:hypothetical protein
MTSTTAIRTRPLSYLTLHKPKTTCPSRPILYMLYARVLVQTDC